MRFWRTLVHELRHWREYLIGAGQAFDPLPDYPPHVVAAPGMLERHMTVCRHDDETDEQYERRCELFDLLCANAADNTILDRYKN